MKKSELYEIRALFMLLFSTQWMGQRISTLLLVYGIMLAGISLYYYIKEK